MAQLRNPNKTREKWSEECKQAWEALKKKLADKSIMGFPDYKSPFSFTPM